MSFLRLLAAVALAFWIGGLITLGALTAPTIFAVLESHDPAGGSELAGVVFGVIFMHFEYATWAAGAVLLLSLGLRALLGPRPRRFGVRMWVAVGMLVASMVSVLAITPRIEAVRKSVSGPVAALSDQDPRKIAFGRWHGLSTGLMLLTIVSGVGLLWTEVRE